MADDLTATLAEIRQNHADCEAARGMWDLSDRADVFYSSVMDIPPLLAALEAALEKADEWVTEAKRIDGIFADDEDPRPRNVGGMRAEAFESCASGLRAAITAALTGKEAGE